MPKKKAHNTAKEAAIGAAAGAVTGAMAGAASVYLSEEENRAKVGSKIQDLAENARDKADQANETVREHSPMIASEIKKSNRTKSKK